MSHYLKEKSYILLKNKKNKSDKNLFFLFLMISGGIVLSSVFITDSNIVNGVITGKIVWFQTFILFFTGCLILSLIAEKKKSFLFNVNDLLLLLFGGVVVLTYNWDLEAEPEKLLCGGQLVIWWSILRYVLNLYSRLKKGFVVIFIATGLVETVWGMMQLYGYSFSNHSLFLLTGSFFNPGPYSGYLAMVLPVCLGVVLGTDYTDYAVKKVDEKKNFKNILLFLISQPRNLCNLCLKYFAWICLLAILVVLPAGMSRSAWIAAIVSCVWVYWFYRDGLGKVKQLWKRNQKVSLLGISGLIIVILIGSTGIYMMKKDSADGRLLMWKITGKAMMKRPFTGTGLGGFPAAYAETQAEYFRSGEATQTEKKVAGCPEYAFNEYLQMGVELGIGGMIVFILWIGSCIYRGVKNRRYGVTGGIVSLGVFAFSSYPLQLTSFWIVLIFLSAIAVTDKERVIREKKWSWYIGLIVVVAVVGIWWLQRGMEEAYEKWQTAKMYYNNKGYEAAYEIYEPLYEKLNHKPEYLFEAGQCLSKMGRYEEANQLLERAILLSADPMIHYILAKNKQMMGEYEEAEKRLIHAIDILPERIYPYYLLTKLYAVPTFYQQSKMLAAADSVLRKEPKVYTTAIHEMREEISKLVQEKNCFSNIF